MKVTMVSGWMAQEAKRNSQINELQAEVAKIKQELGDKETQLQTRVLIPPLDAPTAEPTQFDPIGAGDPGTSDVAGFAEEESDYIISGFSTIDPRETDL